MTSDKKNTKRQSLCIVCGRRLSIKTTSGEIKWRASHVVDDGLYCDGCFEEKKSKPAKKGRS